jgi:transcriptional regulator with XRE-family HTH domain
MADQLPDVRAARLAKGWSITDLARRSNTSDLTIITIENGGTCLPDVAARIRDALRVQQDAPLEPPEPEPVTVKVPVVTPRQVESKPAETFKGKS